MDAGPSIAGRAAVAIALMVGFYLLALGVAAALIVIPWAEIRYGHRVVPYLLILCNAGPS